MSTISAPVSSARLWTGRVLSFLPAAMLLLDAVMKLVKPEEVVKATIELGFPESSITGMGIALLVSVVLYLIPRTAPVGAILVTGYLGGAVCTHVHAGHPTWQIFFPAIFGALMWTGLVMRDPRLEPVLPWRR